MGTNKNLSVAEAAARLGVSQSRLCQLCRAGRLGSKTSGVWVILETELRRFAKRKRLPGRPPRIEK